MALRISGKSDLCEIGAVTVCVLIALLEFLQLYQGYHFPRLLSGDMALNVSLLLPWLHPDLFVGDDLIGDRLTSGPYIGLLLSWVIAAIYTLTDDFVVAVEICRAPLIFIQTYGFYLLGKHLFHSRVLGLLTSLACTIPLTGTLWSIPTFPIGSLWYRALFPFLLIALLKYGHQPRSWPWILGVTGLSMHVHPVGAPGMGFAIWITLIGIPVPGLSIRNRLRSVAVAGFVFLAATLPFLLLTYQLSHHGGTVDHTDLETITDAMYGGALALINTWLSGTGTVKYILLCGGVLGGIARWYLDPASRTWIRLLLLWSVGIIISSVVFPEIERIVAQQTGAPVLLLELPRNIHFLVPVLAIFMVSGAAAAGKKLASTNNPNLSTMAGIAAAVLAIAIYGASTKARPESPFFHHWYDLIPYLPTLHCWFHGEFLCSRPSLRVAAMVDVIDYLRDHVNRKTRILPFSNHFTDDGTAQSVLTAAIRYHSLLPVTYGSQDFIMAVFGDKGPDAPIWRWRSKRRTMDKLYLGLIKELERNGCAGNHVNPLRKTAVEIRAEIIVIELPLCPQDIAKLGTVRFTSEPFKVIEVLP